MATKAAKEIYKDRAATAECVNAIAKNRGLQQFRVRGLSKVRAVLLRYALAHNLNREIPDTQVEKISQAQSFAEVGFQAGAWEREKLGVSGICVTKLELRNEK